MQLKLNFKAFNRGTSKFKNISYLILSKPPEQSSKSIKTMILKHYKRKRQKMGNYVKSLFHKQMFVLSFTDNMEETSSVWAEV